MGQRGSARKPCWNYALWDLSIKAPFFYSPLPCRTHSSDNHCRPAWLFIIRNHPESAFLIGRAGRLSCIQSRVRLDYCHGFKWGGGRIGTPLSSRKGENPQLPSLTVSKFVICIFDIEGPGFPSIHASFKLFDLFSLYLINWVEI